MYKQNMGFTSKLWKYLLILKNKHAMDDLHEYFLFSYVTYLKLCLVVTDE